MKKLFLLLFAGLLLSSISAQDKFSLNADFARFRYSDNQYVIVELYFSVYQRYLKYDFNNNEYTGRANIEIKIYDKNKIVIYDTIGLLSKVPDTSKTKLFNKTLISQQIYTLPVSDYTIKLKGYDYNKNTDSDSAVFNFSLTPYDSLKTNLSDIQLCNSYTKSGNNKSIYFKNGYEIIPNPNGLFGMNLKTLNYYFEVYSLKKDFVNDNIYVVASVMDLSNNLILQTTKQEKSRADAFLEIGQIDVDSLQKGVYMLKIKLLDSTSGFYLEKEKKFYVNNVSKGNLSETIDDKDFLTSEYKTLSQENVDNEYDKSIYIRTSPENEEYAKLKSLDEKRKFLFTFWKKRKINPNSPVNDFKVEYFKRINDANKYYKQGFMDGWKTDKGRIYIIYGRPSEIENHPNEADSKAYEIWSFNNIQGNAICVFAEDEMGGGIFHLVHSTIRGEFSDSDWKTKIKK